MSEPWYVELFSSGLYQDIVRGQTAAANRLQAGFVARVLDLPPGADILDLCCGDGRIAVELARLGYRVTGYDLAVPLLDAARSRATEAGVELELVHGDMRDLPFTRTFAGAVNFFTSFGYFDDGENEAVIQGVARVLAPGGRFLIDVINRDYLVARGSPREWHENDRVLFVGTRELDLPTSRSRATWTILDKREAWARREYRVDVRVYSAHELGSILVRAGLEPLAWYGNYEGAPLAVDLPRLVTVAEKAPAR
ncbi:MAG: class I SAM-dependent methyltransferase [bacterium]|nr:class I SAM-dependent methyltransferase [bacterium]